MNALNTLKSVCLFSFCLALSNSAWSSDADSLSQGQTLYPLESHKTFAGPEQFFTGDVSVELLFPGNDVAHYSGAYVTFSPGARTAWHSHPAGQHIFVVSGTALTGTRDGNIIAFQPGETVWCPPDIDHWHGATANAAMKHLVITGSLNGQNVVWKEKVSDAQYQQGQQTPSASTESVTALSLRQQSIVAISAAAAVGDLTALQLAISNGLDNGLAINDIKEIQIHLYAYAGFPRALNGLATLMNVVKQRVDSGTSDTVGSVASAVPAGTTSVEYGRKVQTELVGRPVAGPLFDFAPDINTLLQGHLFGDLFARGILSYQERELATVAALTAMEGVEPQLRAHIGIAKNVGVTSEQLQAVAVVLGGTMGVHYQARLKSML